MGRTFDKGVLVGVGLVVAVVRQLELPVAIFTLAGSALLLVDLPWPLEGGEDVGVTDRVRRLRSHHETGRQRARHDCQVVATLADRAW